MNQRRRPAQHGMLVRIAVASSATLALLVGLMSVAGAFAWIQARGENVDDAWVPVAPQSAGTGAPETGKCSEQACNYLVLGSDSRAGLTEEEQARFGSNEEIGGENRADTIMLVHTDPALEKAIVLSFPRDLWVRIPGRGSDKINSAFAGGVHRGGPRLMAQTVSNLTGLRIDHYLYVDLRGFQRVVDTLGGVDMCVPAYNVNTPGWLAAPSETGELTEVYYEEPGRIVDPLAGLDIEPGCQHLEGTQALAYVRTRHLPCDSIPDFSRIGRQQQFLRAVINQMLKPGQIARAPGLVSPVLGSLRRDAGLLPGDLVYLAGQLRGVDTGAVEFRSVPGVAGWQGTKSVVEMDPSARRLFAAIRDGRPIGGVGTQLVNTPPSEANTSVVVIDGDHGGAAAEVESMLSTAGFDIAPGIRDEAESPVDPDRAAIVFRPGADAYAQVVSTYFPGLRVVESGRLDGADVAIVVPPGFELPHAGSDGGGGQGGAACPVPIA